MNELTTFFVQYGLALTLFALLGVVILGILKYCNVFSKLNEKVRHILYLLISLALSIISASIYLACTKQFDLKTIATFASATYVLNQAWYCIFKSTSFNDLVGSVLDKLFDHSDQK